MYNNMPEVSAQIEKLDIDIESLHKTMDVHRELNRFLISCLNFHRTTKYE